MHRENKTKVIAISNQKGGVAKTTTAVNLSAALAIAGTKVLLIDLDPQGNASTGLGIGHNNRDTNIYHVITGSKAASEAILKTSINNLDIISADINLSAAEVDILKLSNKDQRLKDALATIENIYDYIIIDCPPSLGQLTLNSLSAANYLLIPMQCEFYALEGLSLLLNTVKMVQNSINPQLKIIGILLTMYDKRYKITEQIEQDVRSYLGDLVFKTNIPRSVRIAEAPSHGKPVLIYDPISSGSKAYHDLAKEVITKQREFY